MLIQVNLTIAEARLLMPCLEGWYKTDSEDPDLAPTNAAKNWKSMIDKLNRGIEEMGQQSEMSKTHDEIEEMFEVVMLEVDGPSVGFIESLYGQWEEKQFLTEKQIEALEKFYENCEEGS